MTKKQQNRRSKIALFTFVILFSFTMGLFLGKNDNPSNFIYAKVNKFKEEWALLVHNQSSKNNEKNQSNTQNAQFHFFDVGQGSATLLQSDDGTTILIDTGRYEDKDKKIMTYLDRYIGTGGKIDLLVFTHNDSDHIGYGDLVLQYYDVKEVWMNGYDSTSKVYERVLDAIGDSQAQYVEPKNGDTHQVGPFYLEVLNPTAELRNDPNDDSIITKISFTNFSGIFSGDASSRVEKDIIKDGTNLKSDLLLMGHHGSKTSTSKKWIEAVAPKISIYSASEGNGYNHPGLETINRLNELDIPVYGTKKNGTITINANKNGSFTIETEKED